MTEALKKAFEAAPSLLIPMPFDLKDDQPLPRGLPPVISAIEGRP
jgi:hypothetical protein